MRYALCAMRHALGPLRQQGRADRAGHLAQRGHFNRLPHFFFERLHDTDIFSHPTGHHDRSFEAGSLDHGRHPGRYGFVDTGNDVFPLDALCNQGYDFRFRKNGAKTADFCGLIGFGGKFTEAIKIDFKRPGHDLQKTAGSGRALIVHGEVFYVAGFIQGYGFAVLPADIDDRSHRRIQVVGAHGMAGNFGDRLVGNRNAVAAVSGCDDSVDGRSIDVRLFENSSKDFVAGPAGIIAGQNPLARNQFAVSDHRRFGGYRSHINANCQHMLSSSRLLIFSIADCGFSRLRIADCRLRISDTSTV